MFSTKRFKKNTKIMNYNFTLFYPKDKPAQSVSDTLRELLIPRKWRHYLRTEQKVKINGKYRYFNQLVKAGDKINLQLDFIESHQQAYPKSGKNPIVVYEDQNLLIINKPKGQKTHPNLFETNTALNDCATYLDYSPFIVHRLDMLTSGLLLVAKNPAVVPILNRELTSKIFKRNYLATVNHPENLNESGTITAPIGQDPNDQRKRIITPDGLHAVTHYQIIQRNTDTAKIKVNLETGRTHQIRVHLTSLGAPIVGDPLYNPEFNAKDNLQLEAVEMQLIKPYSFEKLNVKLK